MNSAANRQSAPSRRRQTRPAVLALALLFCALAAAAAAAPTAASAQTPAVPYAEAEAQAIDRMLMCPVCPAESIDQAQVPLARQMRQQVREMLAAGAGQPEILAWFADRYGPSVLAAPPKTGRNLLAWTLPVAGVLAALLLGGLALRAMTGKNRNAAATSTAANALPPADLAPYLAVVDQTLARPPGNRPDKEGGPGATDG